ncbi:MAG: hypothetical protein N2038_11955 [Geminicoccaceae bacterium]|nr:hypothetical protein [Geminicoccaceae bacterium]MCX7630950.1 hypothetical protein [Geminicoccaceae bacterium]MDW8125081.1 hypothetical protein [Geminicoccaceae bacterium]MDW8340631.1 hypothetical protein [Geminicoccaceae bacterium]
MRTLLLSAALTAGLAAPLAAAPADYPTEALAEYVMGCMAAKGQTPDMLRRCSCSIDRIAARLPYEDYVKAETVLRMRRETTGRDQVVMFRTSPWAQEMVDKLRRAQIEADLECF